MSTAIRKSSASMAAGNNSLEQTFGLVAAGTEILREPGRVANGLSTITARLTKKNDDYIASITGGMGVIDKNTGELRSTYDILQDLSKAWGNLTSVEKQELTETVAGKTQRALFTALMQNFSTAVGASEAALNSEGSAATENAKRMDSLNGKVQQLQSAWQNLARNTINSDFVKNILSAATGMLKLVNSAGGLVPILTSIVSLILVFKSQSIGKDFQKLSDSITSMINGFKILKQHITGAAGANVIYLGSAESATTATTGLNLAISTLSATIGVFLGTVSLASMAVNALYNIQENARNQASEMADKYNTQAEGLSKLKEEYNNVASAQEDTSKTGDDLQKIIDKLVNQYGLSEESLKLENKTREEALGYLEEEILKRERLAAVQSKQSVSTGNWQFQIENDRKMLETTDQLTSKNEKLAKQYDLTGNSLTELSAKYVTAISKLDQKNDRTKQEEKDLKNLTKEYNNITNVMNAFKDGYQNTLELLQSGQQITNKDAVVLKNLGMITQEQLDYIEQINSMSEEAQKQIWGSAEAMEYFSNTSDNTNTKLDEMTEKIQNAEDAADNWNSKLQDNIDQMKNYGDNMDILNVAQQELANSGAITAETFEQITQNNLLGYLDEVDGKLQVNTNSFINSTQSIKDNAIANLEASTYEQIRAVVLEDMKNKEVDAGNAAATASGQLSAAGSQAQIMGAKMLEASGNVAVLTAQLNELNKAEGGSGQVSGDTTKKVQNILSQASKTKAFIESWKPSTSSSAKKSSGGSRRKSSGGSGRKSGSGSKSSSKSIKEEYKAEIDTLYAYKNALDNAKDSVDKLNDALKDTDNFNEQEKILRQLIDATNNQINKTNELKNAQSAQMNNYINQLRAQGFAIDYNASKNELFINNMQHLADFSGDTAKNLEKLIKKIQDLNNDNRSLDGSVRDLTGNVKDYYKQLEDIPEKKLKKFNELMKDFQQNRLDQIQNQIDDIKHEMDNDERIKAIDKQIEALEAENDTLDSQKELEEKILAVEQAKEKLANANKQKTLQVYREGQGFVWETDPDTIKDAADELKQAQDDLNDKIKQDQIDQLQAEKDALEKSYQDRIDALQKFLDEQNYQIDKANREGIKSFQDLQKEMAKYGLDSAEYLGKATDWLNNYNKSLADLNNTVNGILSSSSQATDGLIYSSAVQDRINQALSSIIPVTTQTGLKLNQIDYDKIKGNTDNQSIYINNIELPNVKDIDDFVEALKDLPRMATSQSTMRT